MTIQHPLASEGQAPGYCPPPNGAYAEWQGYEYKSFVPNERQRSTIAAVKAALAAGKYYTEEVRAFCAVWLGATAADQVSEGRIRTEGGEFGMDCYYARNYLRAQQEHEAKAKAMSMLKPYVGKVLGTLTFNDYKRTNAVVVIELFPETDSVRLSGKRGSTAVELLATATQVEGAFNRAKEKGHRKDNFVEFVSSQAATKVPSGADQSVLSEVA